MALHSILSIHVQSVPMLTAGARWGMIAPADCVEHFSPTFHLFKTKHYNLEPKLYEPNLHGHGHYDMASISSLRNEGFMTFMIHVGVVLAKSHHTLADVPFPAQTTIQLLAVVRYKAPALLPQFTIRPKSYLSFTTSKNLPSLQRLHLSPALSASGRSCLLSPFLSFHKCWH